MDDAPEISPEHKALVDDLKSQGQLPADWRYEWKLPKKFRPPKSKRTDRATLKEFRSAEPEPVVIEEMDTSPLPGDEVLQTPVIEFDDGEPDEDLDEDTLRWNKDELKRLRTAKREVSERLLALAAADKDALALCKTQMASIESQEGACLKVIQLFHKKTIDADSNANQVLITIQPHDGDNTGSVQVWV